MDPPEPVSSSAEWVSKPLAGRGEGLSSYIESLAHSRHPQLMLTLFPPPFEASVSLSAKYPAEDVHVSSGSRFLLQVFSVPCVRKEGDWGEELVPWGLKASAGLSRSSCTDAGGFPGQRIRCKFSMC